MSFLPPNPPEKFSSKRKPCPACGSLRGFAPLVNKSENYGYCHACGYAEFPNGKGSKRVNNISYPFASGKKRPLAAPTFKPITTLPIGAYLDPSRYPFNPFASWALRLGVTVEHLQTCGVGTARDGATVFFHKSIDGGEIWFVKCVHYRADGRRDKDRPNGITTPKGYTGADGYTLPLYCPLPFDRTKKTYLVESEKTAVLCSFFLPAFNWFACAGAKGLTTAKLAQLAALAVGATVNVCFDNDPAGIDATARAVEKLKSAGIKTTAKYLTDLQPDAPKGFDLADWIESELDPKKPRTDAPQSTIAEKSIGTLSEQKTPVIREISQTASKESEELNELYKGEKNPVETSIIPKSIDKTENQLSTATAQINGLFQGSNNHYQPPQNYSRDEVNYLVELARPHFWTISGAQNEAESLAELLSNLWPSLYYGVDTFVLRYVYAYLKNDFYAQNIM